MYYRFQTLKVIFNKKKRTFEQTKYMNLPQTLETSIIYIDILEGSNTSFATFLNIYTL